MDAVFRALADPTRRSLLDELFAEDGQSLSALERRLPMTRFGVMKHLRVLEEAGLVTTRRRGRESVSVGTTCSTAAHVMGATSRLIHSGVGKSCRRREFFPYLGFSPLWPKINKRLINQSRLRLKATKPMPRCLFHKSTASSPGFSLGSPRSSVASGAGLEPGAPRGRALVQDLRNGHLVLGLDLMLKWEAR